MRHTAARITETGVQLSGFLHQGFFRRSVGIEFRRKATFQLLQNQLRVLDGGVFVRFDLFIGRVGFDHGTDGHFQGVFGNDQRDGTVRHHFGFGHGFDQRRCADRNQFQLHVMIGVGHVIQFFAQTELLGFFFQFGGLGVNGGFADTAAIRRADVIFSDFGGFGLGFARHRHDGAHQIRVQNVLVPRGNFFGVRIQRQHGQPFHKSLLLPLYPDFRFLSIFFLQSPLAKIPSPNRKGDFETCRKSNVDGDFVSAFDRIRDFLIGGRFFIGFDIGGQSFVQNVDAF